MGEENNNNGQSNQFDPRASMGMIAMGLSVFSIVSCMSGFLASIMAGVAIILALLTSSKKHKMLPQARRAIIFGVVGLVASYSIMISSVHMVLTDPDMRQEMNTMTEEMTGESFDDVMQEFKDVYGLK